MFKREDIKAGYLLCCDNLRDGRKFNMTVMPAQNLNPPFMPKQTPSYLACCNKGMDWAHLSSFDDNLVHANTIRINEIWGTTTPMRLMDNSTADRVLLWTRSPKRMTMDEIEKALGYKVKVVQAGKPAPAPDLFKKSSMYAGMVVQTRDGRKWLVEPSDGGLLLASTKEVPYIFGGTRTETLVQPLSDYLDGLVRERDAGQAPTDIVRVWNRIPGAAFIKEAHTVETTNRKLLWARDDAKRMTLEEIEKALGHKVEVVERVTVEA